MPLLNTPKKLLAAIVCFATMHGAVNAQAIRTNGQQFQDGNGRSFVIHGINSSGLEFGNANDSPGPGGGPFSYWHRHGQDEYKNEADWGFNCVRLPISWANLEPTAPTQTAAGFQHSYNSAYIQAIDEAVRLAAAHRLPVILSMHHNNWSTAHTYQLANGRTAYGAGMPSWLYPDGDAIAAEDALFADQEQGHRLLADTWNMLARRYSGMPNVIGIDIYNEPKWRRAPERGVAEAGLTRMYQRVANSIHSSAPRLLLICQDFADRDPRLQSLPQLPGIVYSFHSYQPWPGAQASFEAHVQRAAQLGAPLLVGEFGRRGDPDWQQSLRAELDYMKAHQISWMLWAYQFYQWPLYGQSGQGPLDDEQLRLVQAAM